MRKECEYMVTVTLKFNEEKLKNMGRTTDEMLEPIRKTLAHFHIEESYRALRLNSCCVIPIICSFWIPGQ